MCIRDCNTSINKKIIQNKKYTKLQGGISGNALYKNSNNILKKLQKFSKGNITLIGVGGIDSGEKVFKKIELGANAVQVYSSLIYNGISIVDKMVIDFVKLSKLNK